MELVGALKEIMEEKQMDWMEEWPCQDIQWWAIKKTSLLSIKNQTTLQEQHSSFKGIGEEMFEMVQVHLSKAIFSQLLAPLLH